MVFVHDGWRGMFGKREVVLYGHFKRQDHAARWAAALERAARPRHQRDLHQIVSDAVAAVKPRGGVD